MKFVFVILLLGVSATTAQINYLTAAYDTALYLHWWVFDYASYHHSILTDEAEYLAKGLVNWIGNAIDRPEMNSTRGEAVQQCALQAGYSANILITNANYALYNLYWTNLEYHQIVNDEITKANLLTEDFDNFYYKVYDRVYDLYYYIEYVINERVIYAISDIIWSYYTVVYDLEVCLSYV